MDIECKECECPIDHCCCDEPCLVYNETPTHCACAAVPDRGEKADPGRAITPGEGH